MAKVAVGEKTPKQAQAKPTNPNRQMTLLWSYQVCDFRLFLKFQLPRQCRSWMFMVGGKTKNKTKVLPYRLGWGGGLDQLRNLVGKNSWLVG